MDHCVLGRPLFPATGYIEAVVAAGNAILGSPPILRNFILRRPLLLSENCTKKLRTIIEPGSADSYTFKILSRNRKRMTVDFRQIGFFTRRASCHGILVNLSRRAVWMCSGRQSNNGARTWAPIMKTCASGDWILAGFPHDSRTMDPRTRECRTRWHCCPTSLIRLRNRYILHPTVLDGAFQILGTALTAAGEGGSYLPIGFESLRLLKKPVVSDGPTLSRRPPDQSGTKRYRVRY